MNDRWLLCVWRKGGFSQSETEFLERTLSVAVESLGGKVTGSFSRDKYDKLAISGLDGA